MTENVPILTIDGPSGSGKGTVSMRIAKQLGWHYLDSGAIYRVVGYLAAKHNIDSQHESALVELVDGLQLQFIDDKVLLNDEDLSPFIRTEQAGSAASTIAVLPKLRLALLQWQRDYARLPGLVADGRDMGTVVFPEAACKVFLSASAQQRAQRRAKQLMDKGFDVNIDTLTAEIQARDERDQNRSVSPMVPADDAVVIDSSHMSIEDVVQTVLAQLRKSTAV